MPLLIARAFVSVCPQDAAALLVYFNSSRQGSGITLEIQSDSNPRVKLKNEELYSSVVGRKIDDEMIYAAVFPRLYFFTEVGDRAQIEYASCKLIGGNHFIGNRFVQEYDYVTLYPGIITEVDWSNRSV